MYIIPVHPANKGKIKDGSTMAGIDYSMKSCGMRKWPNNCVINFVVHNLPGSLVVEGAQSFIEPVNLVIVVVLLS